MMQEFDLPTSVYSVLICLLLGSLLLVSKKLCDCIISILRTSFVILINGGLLAAHPPELRFPAVEGEKLTSCSTNLTNKTDRYVAFQVDSTRALMVVHVVPDKEVILPKSRCNLTVTIRAPKHQIALEGSVIIQSVVVDDKTSIESVSSEKFDKAFAIVDEVKLKVAYGFTSPLSGIIHESENKRSSQASSAVDAVARFNHRFGLDRARENGGHVKRFLGAFAVFQSQEPASVDSKGVESGEEGVQSSSREITVQNSGRSRETPNQMIQKQTTKASTLKALNHKIRLLQEDNNLLQKESDALKAERGRVQERLREAIDDRNEAVRGSEELKDRHRVVLEQLRKADGEKLEAELRADECEGVAKGFKLQFQTLQARCDALQKERDDAAREAAYLRGKLERYRTGDSGVREAFRSDFSRSELVQATRNFHDSLKIGEGGFGNVYRACLRNTVVAIKVQRAQSSHGRSQFHQEETILSKVRHPNLVTLVGACSEEGFLALIYEYLPNGSLEDWLRRCNTSNGSGAAGTMFTWRIRTRIVAEMCSALVFLHSVKPNPIVHGDVKPANILLDANMVSKLGDFGTARLLLEDSDSGGAPYRFTQPKGTLHYVDPEFVSTGELTTRSDVYSFGIVILQLLTGKPAVGIVRRVQEAMDMGHLHSVMDPSTGAWPAAQSKKLARLALRCCQTNRLDRPDLAGEVCGVIEALTNA